jgi:hypothetical protein
VFIQDYHLALVAALDAQASGTPGSIAREPFGDRYHGVAGNDRDAALASNDQPGECTAYRDPTNTGRNDVPSREASAATKNRGYSSRRGDHVDNAVAGPARTITMTRSRRVSRDTEGRLDTIIHAFSRHGERPPDGGSAGV